VAATTTKSRLLVADDDEEILRIVSLVLTKAGYQVIEANDGNEALQKAQAEKPDAILLDIKMPGMDGLTVLERLRSEESLASIPVGFLTGQEDTETYERARVLGGQIYLLKPFSAAKLVTFVDLLLGERHE
jgi:two-component system chemotaxis response regulator CheY